MKKLIFLIVLSLMVVPGISEGAEKVLSVRGSGVPHDSPGEGLSSTPSGIEAGQASSPVTTTTATVTAGIYTYLDLLIEQMDSQGKVTYSSWGDLGLGLLWGDHFTQMKDGKFDGNVFSGSWDYVGYNSHHSGKMYITLDDVLNKATKVLSFSAEDTEQYTDGSAKITMKIGGGGGNFPPPTRTTSPSGNSTTTFQITGTGTCGSISSFNYELIPNVDWKVHTIVAGYQCDGQSKLIIQFDLGDPCSGKIPLPKGSTSFDVADVSSYSNEVPSAILGSDPAKISPLGFGKKTTDGKDGSPSSYQVKLCAFEKPVDIYFEVEPYWGYYFLNQNNKVIPLEKLKPWRTNVTGAIDEQISGDFGGLFNGGRIPKGEYGFQIIAVPAGVNLLNASDAYFWKYVVDTRCKGYTPMPTGREFFGIDKPLALPVTGDDPEQILPLSVAHYAVGGEMLLLGAEFCPFDEHVDTHFGIYCPEDDPLNYYFVNGQAKQEQDLFQKVSMLRLPFSAKLPKEALVDDDSFDTDQEDQTNLFISLEASKLPKGSCQYVVAVTPVGVRDKYYAWVLPLDVNIKKAFIDLWKQLQKTGGSTWEKRPGLFYGKGGVK